ncbi:MAG: conjugal transfer protein TraF [Planctomycetaceae bacterium]|nr:conjugal transfer protein TraF [Planctomycetaceae bacterium]
MSAVISHSVYAVPFTFDARTLAMGGVSVATSDLATAAWANPSMLTRQTIEDDFALLIGLGGFVRDNDELIGDVEDFQNSNELRKEAIDNGDLAGEAGAILDMRYVVGGIDGKVIAPEATAMMGIGIAFESFSMAFSVRSDVISGGAVTDLSCSLFEAGCDPNELISEEFNILNLEGVQATEYGVSFARDFDLFDRRLSIGIKPKVIDLRAFTFRESILTVSTSSEDYLDEVGKRNLGTFSTVDVGLAMDLSESFLLGLNVRNLFTDRFNLGDHALNYDTEAKIGIAHKNSFMLLALDYDLTTNKPLLANDSLSAPLETRYLNLGVEFSAGDIVSLRAGVARNTASGVSSGAKDTQYTLGIGFWLGFNLDAAVIANNNSQGVMLQSGFRF